MMNLVEQNILQILDKLLKVKSVIKSIDPIVARVEQELIQDHKALMAWEPIPLTIYGKELPAMILSSWVFILRAGATTGAERHPNSHQRMISYRGKGDIQLQHDEKWHSHFLVSDLGASLESRRASIPPNTWHQVVVPAKQHWVVVSFHTVPETELIEERPDLIDPKLNRQKKYLSKN